MPGQKGLLLRSRARSVQTSQPHPTNQLCSPHRAGPHSHQPGQESLRSQCPPEAFEALPSVQEGRKAARDPL